jgi:(2Fe-2S) ferredoxin
MLKRKYSFIECNISRYVYSTSVWFKALDTFVARAIAKKHTPSRAKREFMIVIRSKVRPTGTTEHTKRIIVRCFF